jgi:hypothetical protein
MARREEEIRAVERRGWKKSSNPVMSQMNSLIAGEWELLCNFRNCSRCRQDSEGGGPAREAREPPLAAGVGKGAISPPEALPRPRVRNFHMYEFGVWTIINYNQVRLRRT